MSKEFVSLRRQAEILKNLPVDQRKSESQSEPDAAEDILVAHLGRGVKYSTSSMYGGRLRVMRNVLARNLTRKHKLPFSTDQLMKALQVVARYKTADPKYSRAIREFISAELANTDPLEANAIVTKGVSSALSRDRQFGIGLMHKNG